MLYVHDVAYRAFRCQHATQSQAGGLVPENESMQNKVITNPSNKTVLPVEPGRVYKTWTTADPGSRNAFN